MKPKGGETYLFQSRSINSKLDFGCDQYRFLLKGSGKNEILGIYKRYYQLKDHESCGRKTVSSFQRQVYSLISAEECSDQPPIYLVHYLGDSSCHRDTSHGNCKWKGMPYFPTSKECMEEIKGDEGFTAKETYRKLHTKHSNKNDQLRMPTDRPKSTKQCENVK